MMNAKQSLVKFYNMGGYVRSRQEGSPPEGEVPTTRSEQALRAYLQAANPRASVKQQPLRPGVMGAVRTSNPDELLLSSGVKKGSGPAEEVLFHELEHSLSLRGGNPLGAVDRKDGEPINTDNNYRFDILYNMQNDKDKKVEKPGVGELLVLQRSGEGERKRLAMINNFVKNRAAIEQFFDRSIRSAYFHPNMLKAQAKFGTEGALFAEQIADLSALEQLTGKSLTKDKDMRKLLFPDDRSADVYDAITGYRQTRLDAKDLPPYTPIAPEKEGMSGWLKDKLGMKEGGEVVNDDYIQQMMTGTPPSDRTTNPGLLPSELRNVVDVPLDLANTFLRSAAGSIAGPVYGLYKGFTSDKFGTPEGVQEASSEAGRMMQKISGTPKTQTGRDVMEFIGEKAEALKLAPTPQLLTAPLPGPGSASALLRSYELAETPPEGVIKLPGGNYLAGQVEKALNETKSLTAGAAGKSPEIVLQEMKATYPPEVVKTLSPESVAQVNRAFADLEPKVALNKWIDSKLTKYVKNDMATERDPLRLQADKWATEQQPKLLAEKDAQIAKAKADMEKAQRERGVEPEMLTRSRARILELEKEREFIAARTGLHFLPGDVNALRAQVIKMDRENAGFPGEATAVSPIARDWENLADQYLAPRSSAEHVRGPGYFMRDTDAQRIMAENPWLSNVPPETQVQFLNRGISQQDTGFKHMIDELRNALNPDSGLPPNLQISTKDLEKMTVPQAADLVDRINAHRAVQKAEADKLAAQKSIEVYKEYPESEQGLRWVEIKMLPYPETLPEGFEIVNKAPKAIQVRKIGEKQVISGKDLKDVIDGIYNYYPDTPGNSRKALEEALRYEGDIMQHCVGGYCPDVESGKSRIISLRDAKGEPHVTIEVAPGEDFKKNPGQWLNTLPVEQQEAIIASGVKPGDLPEYQQWAGSVPEKIVQIKGKGNRKAAEQYQPFINDFIASQPWSEIGDLSYTNLVPLKPELLKNAQDRGFNPKVITTVKDQSYITKDEFNRLAGLFGGMNKYAAGGEVTKFIKAHA